MILNYDKGDEEKFPKNCTHSLVRGSVTRHKWIDTMSLPEY